MKSRNELAEAILLQLLTLAPSCDGPEIVVAEAFAFADAFLAAAGQQERDDSRDKCGGCDCARCLHGPAGCVGDGDKLTCECRRYIEQKDGQLEPDAVWVLRNIVLGHDIMGMRAEAAMLVAKYEEVDSE